MKVQVNGTSSIYKYIIVIAVIVFGVIVIGNSSASESQQSIICNHTISVSVTDADGTGNFSSVKPGDFVCLTAGSRAPLKLSNFSGTVDKKITFVNYGGVVNISGAGYAGIELKNNKHIRVTGSNLSDVRVGALYEESEQNAGIRIRNTDRGVSFQSLSRFKSELPAGGVGVMGLEIDHIDVGNNYKSGIHGGTDLSLNQNYYITDVKLHHNYIHDFQTTDTGEGFYIGSSYYYTNAENRVGNVEISYNRVMRTTRDGIQLGSASFGDNNIHHNVVGDIARLNEENHSFGIIVNRGSATNIYANFIHDTPRDGIRDQGLRKAGGQRIYNNVVVRSGQKFSANGIRVTSGDQSATNPDTSDYPRSVKFFNNTIQGASAEGIYNANGQGTTNEARNNIIRLTSGVFRLADGATQTESHNITVDPLFVDVANDNYKLSSNSPARDAGISLPGIVDSDITGNLRPSGTAWDVGAYEYYDGTPNPTPKIGDLNNDNTVNSADLAILLTNYKKPGSFDIAQGDLNSDSRIDIFDVSVMISNWSR